MPDDPRPPERAPAESAPANPSVSPEPATPSANTLTPEEQMALYEKELKETDWGHQPC